MTDRIALVANPVASQFTGGDHRIVRATLERRFEVEALWPTSASHAREIVADRISQGVVGVVAMGGDGVVHQIAQALVGTDAFLGIIPVGTTNVLARLLGIPTKARKAARLIVDGPSPVLTPTVRLQFHLGDTTDVRHAVFAAGAGLDADVVAAAETEPHRKLRFGSIHYARTAVGVLLRDYRRSPRLFTVESEGRTATTAGLLAQFHPVYTYFGRVPLRIRPEQPDPMTLLLIERVRVRRLAPLFLRFARGADLGDLPEFHTWSHARSAVMTSEQPVNLQADGELLGPCDRLTLEYVPDSIRVVARPRTERGRFNVPAVVVEWVSRFLPGRDGA